MWEGACARLINDYDGCPELLMLWAMIVLRRECEMPGFKVLALLAFIFLNSEVLFAASIDEIAFELSGYGSAVSLIEIYNDDIYVASRNKLYRQNGINGRIQDISEAVWKEGISSLREIDFSFDRGNMWFIGTRKPFCTREKNYFGLFSKFEPCQKDSQSYDFNWMKKEVKSVSRIGEKQEINSDRSIVVMTHFKGPVQLYSTSISGVEWEYWQDPRAMWSRDLAINELYLFFTNVSYGGILIRRLSDGKMIHVKGSYGPSTMDANDDFLVFDSHLKGAAYIPMKAINALF